MVDLRELQKKGIVIIPKKDVVVPQNEEGFIEVAKKPTSSSLNSQNSGSDFLGFMSGRSGSSSFSTETDGYNKREVDDKITNLDNKIYKLENRVELLERKIGVAQPSDSGSNLIGW